MNDPLTDEDAEQIVLTAKLSGRPVKFVAQVYFLTLQSNHSALREHMQRWEFQIKLNTAEKKFDEELKAAHSQPTQQGDQHD